MTAVINAQKPLIYILNYIIQGDISSILTPFFFNVIIRNLDLKLLNIILYLYTYLKPISFFKLLRSVLWINKLKFFKILASFRGCKLLFIKRIIFLKIMKSKCYHVTFELHFMHYGWVQAIMCLKDIRQMVIWKL